MRRSLIPILALVAVAAVLLLPGPASAEEEERTAGVEAGLPTQAGGSAKAAFERKVEEEEGGAGKRILT